MATGVQVSKVTVHFVVDEQGVSVSKGTTQFITQPEQGVDVSKTLTQFIADPLQGINVSKVTIHFVTDVDIYMGITSLTPSTEATLDAWRVAMDTVLVLDPQADVSGVNNILVSSVVRTVTVVYDSTIIVGQVVRSTVVRSYPPTAVSQVVRHTLVRNSHLDVSQVVRVVIVKWPPSVRRQDFWPTLNRLIAVRR